MPVPMLWGPSQGAATLLPGLTVSCNQKVGSGCTVSCRKAIIRS